MGWQSGQTNEPPTNNVSRESRRDSSPERVYSAPTDPRHDTAKVPKKRRWESFPHPLHDVLTWADVVVKAVHGRAGNPYVYESVQVQVGGLTQEPPRNLAP